MIRYLDRYCMHMIRYVCHSQKMIYRELYILCKTV
jgi:hypothetical protein